MRGAREIDERKRTDAVRWSEAIERNEADGPFSTACYRHTKINSARQAPDAIAW